MSIASLTKIIKCADTSDTVTLRADESQDVLGLLFENKSARLSLYPSPPKFWPFFCAASAVERDGLGGYRSCMQRTQVCVPAGPGASKEEGRLERDWPPPARRFFSPLDATFAPLALHH